MPSARGSINCNGSRLVGTFDVDGSPRYITVDVKPCNRPFECSIVTLTYSDITQLSGDCKWNGWVGREDLQMKFDAGVSIIGPLATARSSSDRTRGAGAWTDMKPSPSPSIYTAETLQGNVSNTIANQFSPHYAARNSAQLEREQQLIGLGVPIVA